MLDQIAKKNIMKSIYANQLKVPSILLKFYIRQSNKRFPLFIKFYIYQSITYIPFFANLTFANPIILLSNDT